jgi:hypothetical protein
MGFGDILDQLQTASPQAVPGQSTSLMQASPSARAADVAKRANEPTKVASDLRSIIFITVTSKGL